MRSYVCSSPLLFPFFANFLSSPALWFWMDPWQNAAASDIACVEIPLGWIRRFGMLQFGWTGLVTNHLQSWDDPPSMVDGRNPAAVEIYETLVYTWICFFRWCSYHGDSSPLSHHLVLFPTFSKHFKQIQVNHRGYFAILNWCFWCLPSGSVV